MNNKATELKGNLLKAINSGKFAIAIFHMDAKGELFLNRMTKDMEKKDLSRCVDLFSDDVMKEMDFDFLEGLKV